MSIDLFSQSIIVWACIKQTDTPHHIKASGALMKVACSFRSATAFPGYISMYTGIHLDVSLCWGDVSSGIP